MTKQELINDINGMGETQTMIFHEVLDTQQNNTRVMGCDKTELLEIVNDFFDDNLYGHVRDGVMTTILGYTIID